MGFEGHLGSVSFADILNTLCKMNKEGTLHVADKKNKKKIIHFRDNGVTLIGGSEPPLLQEILVQEGKLKSWELDKVLAEQRESGESLEVIVINQGLVTEEEIEAIICEHIEEEICDIFFWEDAHFSFKEGAPSEEEFHIEGENPVSLTFNVQSLLFGIAEKIEEWESIRCDIPSLDMVLIAQDNSKWEVEDQELQEAFEKILEFLDGSNDINDVVRITNLSILVVCRMLSLMINHGMVAAANYDELIGMAEYFRDRSQTQKQIKFLERALQLRPNQEELILQIARTYESISNGQGASQYYCRLAELLSKEDPKQGVKYYETAIGHVPRNMEPREKLLELARITEDKDKELYHARSLARIYQKEKHKKNLSFCEEYVQRFPNEIEFYHILANAYLSKEDNEKAVKVYEEIAEMVKARDNLGSYIETLEKILELVPDRNDIKKKLIEIQRLQMWQKKGHYIIAGVIAVILVVSFLFYGMYYELTARSAYKRANGAFNLHQRPKAKQIAAQIVKDRPWSTTVTQAQELLKKIAAQERILEQGKQQQIKEIYKKIKERYLLIKEKAVVGKIEEAKQKLQEYIQDDAEIKKKYRFIKIELTRLEKDIQDFILDREKKLAQRKETQQKEKALKYEKDGRLLKAVEAWKKLLTSKNYKKEAKKAIEKIDKVGRKRLLTMLKDLEKQAYTAEARYKYDKAIELYKKIVEVSGQIPGKPNKFERDRIIQYAQTAENGIQRLEDLKEKIVILWGKIQSLVKSGEPGKAFKEAIGVLENSRLSRTKGAKKILLPIKLNTSPEGAVVKGFAKAQGKAKTPCVVWISPYETSSIKLVKSGFNEVKLSLDRDSEASYSKKLEKTKHWKYQGAKGRIETSPVTLGSTLVYSTRSGRVVALNQRNGRKSWIYKIPGYGDIAGGVALFSQNIYVGSVPGQLFSLGMFKGKKQWHYNAKAKISMTPLAEEKSVFFGDEKGNIYCINRSNGREKWRRQVGGKITSTPVLRRPLILFSNKRQEIIAANIVNGNIKWKLKLRGNAVNFILSGNNLLAVSDRGHIYSYNVRNRKKPKWLRELGKKMSVRAGMVVHGNKIFIATFKGLVYCFSRKDGSDIWDEPVPIPNGIASTPAYSQKQNLLYVADRKGTVYSLSGDDGFITWQEKLFQKRGVEAGLFINKNMCFVGNTAGILYALGE